MVRKRQGLRGLVVALCVGVGTLTACGMTTDDRQVVTADEIAQQESTKAEREKPQKRKTQKSAPAGSTATNAELDAYVVAGEKMLKATFGDSFKKIYSKIDIVPVYPNGVEYDYTFRAALDPATAAAQLDVQVPTLRTQTRTVVVPEMERLGFADPTVTFTYRNPDGSVIWTRTFS